MSLTFSLTALCLFLNGFLVSRINLSKFSCLRRCLLVDFLTASTPVLTFASISARAFSWVALAVAIRHFLWSLWDSGSAINAT